MSRTLTLAVSPYESTNRMHHRSSHSSACPTSMPLPLPLATRYTVASTREVDPVVIRRLRDAYTRPWGIPIPPTQRKAQDREKMSFVTVVVHNEKGKQKQSDPLRQSVQVFAASLTKVEVQNSNCDVCPACATPMAILQRHTSSPEVSSSTLSDSRSPLFDDDDDDDDLLSVSATSGLSTSVSEASSVATSPSQSPHLSPASKWGQLPRHRRALLMEAKSWPIFASPPDATSSVLRKSCDCDKGQAAMKGASLPRRASTGTLRVNRRHSASSLVLTPALADPLHEALAQRNVDDTTDEIERTIDCRKLETTRAVRIKPRESLLTKSLRQLSSRLPNIQWGQLIPAPPSTGEDFVRRGVLDLNGFGVDDWVTGDMRNCEEDPEMEWSSMMVQLQTFSISSAASSPTIEPSTTTTTPPGTTTPSSVIDDDQDCKRGRSRSTLASLPRPTTVRSAGPSRASATVNDGSEVANMMTRRIVSNPFHLLQLALEMEMMRERKIRSPLRPRAVKVLWVNGGGGTQQTGVSWQMRQRKREESSLRWEVGV